MLKSSISRRDFLRNSAVMGGSAILLPNLVFASACAGLENTNADYHVHLTNEFTIREAVKLSQERKVKFGIVEHPGPRYTSMNDDAALLKYIEELRQYPVFVGLQPVDPGWRKRFSETALSRLDYIIMDALELPNPDGSYFRIWESNTRVDNIEKFMARYVDFYKQVLGEEKPDILASPTYLPDSLKPEYRRLWTEKRMKTIIESAIKNKVAIEINSMYKIPDERFVGMAKQMGAKFSFGTNGRNSDICGNLDYSLTIARACSLTSADFFKI